MNRKQKDIGKRKLSVIGRGSIGLTIPAEYLAKLGWKNKQLVKVELKGKHLIVKDWKK